MEGVAAGVLFAGGDDFCEAFFEAGAGFFDVVVVVCADVLPHVGIAGGDAGGVSEAVADDAADEVSVFVELVYGADEGDGGEVGQMRYEAGEGVVALWAAEDEVCAELSPEEGDAGEGGGVCVGASGDEAGGSIEEVCAGVADAGFF